VELSADHSAMHAGEIVVDRDWAYDDASFLYAESLLQCSQFVQ
jgi:hypothetical protein